MIFPLQYKYNLFEFFHLKPVNEFTEFTEFLIDTCREITILYRCNGPSM